VRHPTSRHAPAAHNKDARARRYALPRHVVRAVRQSPGRARPAEPGLWLPLPDVDALPELEELLLGGWLVDSGQTMAIGPLAQAEPVEDHDSAVTLLDPEPVEPVEPVEPAEPHGSAVTLLEPDPVRGFVEPAPAATVALAPSYHPSELAPVETGRGVVWAPRSTRSRSALMAARRAKRNRRHLALLVLLAVAVAIAAAWPRLLGRSATTVRFAVDGRTSVHRVKAATVGDALRAAGVSLGGFDRVTPSLREPLRPNMKVSVRRAVPVTVSVDAGSRSVLTAATTVEELRDQLGLRPTLLTRGDTIGAGTTIAFRTPRRAALTVDGTTTSLTSSARTVDELLADQHVVVGPDDIVAPARDVLLASGTTVQVVRVAGQYTTEQQVVPAGVQYTKDAALPVGQTRVVQPGTDGVRVDTYRITTHDGQVADRQRISSTVAKAALPRVIATGAKVPVAPKSAPKPAAAAGANAVASVSTTHTQMGSASWYSFAAGTCAHKTIPKGTVVKVTNQATGMWTTCMVADRGPFGAGRILDLSRDVFAKLAPNSSGVISVKAEW